MVEYGGAKVRRVGDAVYAGAVGALKLAMSMPREQWVRTRAFCWWAALLHFDKLMQIPLAVVRENGGGVGYRELFEVFSEATRAAVRTPSASASAMSTCATPRSSAQRSISTEPSRSPTSPRPATVKPLTSA